MTAITPSPRPLDIERRHVPGLNPQQHVTPWITKLAELGEIKGGVDLIRLPWEQLESMAYIWMWQWVI